MDRAYLQSRFSGGENVMSGTSRHLSNRLAIEGGSPVRDTPLPWELPGAYYIGEEEKRLVNQVMDARSPFRFYGLDAQGMVDRLESEWCSTFGHKHALGVNSGSAALHIALAAFGVGPGDEVMVPGLHLGQLHQPHRPDRSNSSAGRNRCHLLPGSRPPG